MTESELGVLDQLADCIRTQSSKSQQAHLLRAFAIRPVPEPTSGPAPNLLVVLRDAGVRGVSITPARLRGRRRWQEALQQLADWTVLRWLGNKGFGPLARFCNAKGQLDQPVSFDLAYKLRQWDLRLTIARNFYLAGFTGATTLDDGFLSGLMDAATSRVLGYFGFSSEARLAGQRADRDLTRMGVPPLVFVVKCGRALVEIYTGNLNAAIDLASEALEIAEGQLGQVQDICDALCLLARAHGLCGRHEEAHSFLSLAIPPRPVI